MLLAGASVDVENSTITGAINQIYGGSIRICGSTVGPVGISLLSTSFVVIGDARDGCATNTIKGSLTLLNNTNGVQVIGNSVNGAVIASGNSGAGPFPDDTSANISGNHR